MPEHKKQGGPLGVMRRIALALGGLAAMAGFSAPSQAAQCARTVSVDAVTIDQPIVNSRLGVSNVNGMMFALRQDVRPIDPTQPITALVQTGTTAGRKNCPRGWQACCPRPRCRRTRNTTTANCSSATRRSPSAAANTTRIQGRYR